MMKRIIRDRCTRIYAFCRTTQKHWLFLNLYSFKGPWEFLHPGITDIRFLAKSTVNLKYCLLFVDLFTSKIYTYPTKNRSLLRKNVKLFCHELSKSEKLMREWKCRQIKKLSKTKQKNWIRSTICRCSA